MRYAVSLFLPLTLLVPFSLPSHLSVSPTSNNATQHRRASTRERRAKRAHCLGSSVNQPLNIKQPARDCTQMVFRISQSSQQWAITDNKQTATAARSSIMLCERSGKPSSVCTVQRCVKMGSLNTNNPQCVGNSDVSSLNLFSLLVYKQGVNNSIN